MYIHKSNVPPLHAAGANSNAQPDPDANQPMDTDALHAHPHPGDDGTRAFGHMHAPLDASACSQTRAHVDAKSDGQPAEPDSNQPMDVEHVCRSSDMFGDCDHDRVTAEQLAAIDALPEKHRRFIRAQLKKRNGLVVECSPAISACAAYNTCMSFLGTARCVFRRLET